jgi:hypothetical protein
VKIEFNQKPLPDFWIGLHSRVFCLGKSAVKTSYGWGVVVSSLDELGAQSKLLATPVQKNMHIISRFG